MKSDRPIQLSIPTPCNEDWAQMTPDERGRFCSHCQKSVVDFTAWTDEQLHQFFTSQKEDNVCGRLSSLQLSRDIYAASPIHTSSAPKHWLAAAILLLVGATPAANAQEKTKAVITSKTNHTTKIDTTQKITCQVLDETKQPILHSIIEISQNGLPKSGIATDENGNYTIDATNLDLTTGASNIDIRILYTSYITQHLSIPVNDIFQHRIIVLQPSKEELANVIVLGGKVPIYREEKKPNFFRRSWSWIKGIF